MNYGNRNFTFNRSGYNGGNYRGGYMNQRQNQQAGQGAPRKKSGCKLKSGWVSKATGEKVDENCISGWNVSKRGGFISFVASPRKDKSKRKTKNPKFENWHVSVFYGDTRETKHFNGLYNLHNGKLTIPDMGMVANPAARNGGYFGTFKKRN